MASPQAVWELMSLIVSAGSNIEADAIRKGTARQFKQAKPTSTVNRSRSPDTDNGKVVAKTLWRFHDSNPYRTPFGVADATWFLEGELRDFCNPCIRN